MEKERRKNIMEIRELLIRLNAKEETFNNTFVKKWRETKDLLKLEISDNAFNFFMDFFNFINNYVPDLRNLINKMLSFLKRQLTTEEEGLLDFS